MIYLNEVCEKLDEILNGSGNPTDFYYDVQTVGFHLDKVYDKSFQKTKQKSISLFGRTDGIPVTFSGKCALSAPSAQKSVSTLYLTIIIKNILTNIVSHAILHLT